MAEVYISLMKKGLRTMEQVPDKWKTEVQALLDVQ